MEVDKITLSEFAIASVLGSHFFPCIAGQLKLNCMSLLPILVKN